MKSFVKIKTMKKLEKLPIGTVIKYFYKVGDVWKFCSGGKLYSKNSLPRSITLIENNKIWAVGTKNTALFKLQFKELKLNK